MSSVMYRCGMEHLNYDELFIIEGSGFILKNVSVKLHVDLTKGVLTL
jgi:hypothetical protein